MTWDEALAQATTRNLLVNGLGQTGELGWSVCLATEANPPQLFRGQGATPWSALEAALAADAIQGHTTFTEKTPSGQTTYTSETRYRRRFEPEQAIQTRIEAVRQVDPKLGAQLSLSRLGL